MRTWVKYTLLVYAALLIGLALTAYIWGIPEKPILKGWSEEATDYRNNYLLCIYGKTGMPAGPIPEAIARTKCASGKFANRTDNVVDLIDVRAAIITYMIDEGYYPGDYEDGCAALINWESACNVPYPIDCSEIIDFINANHDDIAAAFALC